MANLPELHTPIPKDVDGHHGEHELGVILSKIEDQQLELWFDVNYLPEVPDIDLILYSPKVGVFVSEVKGHRLDEIKEYDFTTLLQTNGKKAQHPVHQVKKGNEQLRNYFSRLAVLRSQRVKPPFLQTTVFWPRITRAEWNGRFKEPQFVDQAYHFIFKDDLTSGHKLITRLSDLATRPLHGTVVPQSARGNHEGVPMLRELLKPKGSVGNVSPTKVSQIRSVKPDSVKVVDQYPYGPKYDVFFTGHPGTGKTTLLEEIGIRHAREGASVLFICFNKVLATEARRNFQILRAGAKLQGHIDVFDEYDLYSMILPNPDPAESAVQMSTAEQVIAQLATYSEGYKPKYDTILIDESQDLSGGVFLLARELSKPETSWFVAYGKGQELFGYETGRPMPATELEEWMKSASRVRRPRQFRGAPLPFLAAQAFYEQAPNIEAGIKFIHERALDTTPSPGGMQLTLDLPSPASSLDIEYGPGEEDKKDFIRSCILKSVQEVRDAGAEADLLILVASGNAQNPTYPTVIETLTQLEVPIHDLTKLENRRIEAPPGSVRISTSMGVRGITASHVLVFDFAYLQGFCERPELPPIRNLGYVVLSRATQATRIVVPTDEINESVRFLQASIDELRRLELTGQRK